LNPNAFLTQQLNMKSLPQRRSSVAQVSANGEMPQSLEKRCPKPNDNGHSAPGRRQTHGHQSNQPDTLQPSLLSQRVAKEQILAWPGNQFAMAIQYGDDSRADDCVRVYKKQSFALRRARTGISRRGDSPMMDAHYARLVLSRDFRDRIGRGIIHDNDFIRPANGVSRAMNRLQRAANPRLLVMRGNDARYHGHSRLLSGLTGQTDGRYARKFLATSRSVRD
jgi:hypothetical protein